MKNQPIQWINNSADSTYWNLHDYLMKFRKIGKERHAWIIFSLILINFSIEININTYITPILLSFFPLTFSSPLILQKHKNTVYSCKKKNRKKIRDFVFVFDLLVSWQIFHAPCFMQERKNSFSWNMRKEVE